jgi:hypothetical protein
MENTVTGGNINEPKEIKVKVKAHKPESDWPIRKPRDNNEVTYRLIAETMAKHTTTIAKDLPELVNTYLETIKGLDSVSKVALKQAFVWASKVPQEEREDFIQDVFTTIYDNRVNDERLAYAMARCDWKDWWKSYKLHSQFAHTTRLDDTVSNSDGELVQWSDLFIGEAEFESKLIADLDASQLLSQFPTCFRKIVEKQLSGIRITGGERRMLDKWVKSRPTCLASYYV